MFRWNEDRIRFMQSASEYGAYHRRLTDWMRPFLQQRQHICDAGCGLGYLSLSLAPYVRQVTAADCNRQALAVLADNCAKRSIHNIDIRCGDLFTMRPAAPYDAMVFSFFGKMEEIAAIAAAQCRGTVFAFKKNYATHRFSVGTHAVGDDSFSAATDWLTRHGIPFSSQELELEMGQPFRSWEEARLFFRLYSHDPDKSLITDAFLRGRLKETGRTDFPLYLPHTRSLGCIKFSSEDLSDIRR